MKMSALKKKQFDELCGLFMKVRTRNDAALFLKDILTPQEIDSVSERIQIFKLLGKGLPHRKISHDLKVSISKVTRGSHALKISKGLVSKMFKIR